MAVLRRFKIWCSYVAIVTLITSTALSVEFAGGTGEPNDPYQIATAEQLISIGSDPNLLYEDFVLVNDIDLDPNLPGMRSFTRAVIAPVKDAIDKVRWGFAGSFDGNGHRIRNLTIHGGTAGNLGLFGIIAEGGRIHNLVMENTVIIGANGSRSLGGLVGSSVFGTINSCYVTGKVSGGDNSSELGGLVGSVMQGTITNCYTTASVSAGEDANSLGGLAGLLATGRIANCYATGNVSGGDRSMWLGGLVGVNGSMISNCYAIGSVSGGEDANELGSLVGWNWQQGRIINCYFLNLSNGNGLDNGVGVPLTEKQMKQKSRFVDWDFDDIWMIIEGKDYPVLQADAPEPPKPSPPDLIRCTRVEIMYYPSTLESVCIGVAEQSLLSPEEIQYLQSFETIIADDEDSLKAFAHDVSLGSYSETGGAISALPLARFVCYHNGEHLASFALFGPCIGTDEGHWFEYDKGWPSLGMLTPQIRPFRLRLSCARILVALRNRLRSLYESGKEYSAFKWCDAIVRADRAIHRTEKYIVRQFKCPAAGEGRCHYALNTNCKFDSAPDTVLLFETKASWNQHGGPELFTFDNHDPHGGCVLLNDGTVKFIRTKEELQQLRWK